MCILHIETSTAICSVAISQDGQILLNKEHYQGPSHATVLGVFVDEAFTFIENEKLILESVAVSCGPGSYTGLRIGVSMAKGICYGKKVPLLGISTLEMMCVPILLHHDLPEDALLCPMLDARRMEVYAGIYDRSLNTIRPVGADIIDETSYQSILDQHSVYFFGEGAEKCKSIITHANAHFMDPVYPLAKQMIPLAERAFCAKKFEDVAYFEPFYLKEFVASQPKNRLL